MRIHTLSLLSLAAGTTAATGPMTGATPKPTQATASRPHVAGEYVYTTERTGGIHDFDFLAGVHPTRADRGGV